MAALPVIAAVGVFGVSFGVLAAAAGFPAWLAVVMSATVFAGSSQFAAVSVLGAGGSPAAAVLSGVLLNSRYLATGAVAAPVLPGRRVGKWLLAQLVVDESYAVGVGAGTAGVPEPRAMVGTGAGLWVAWVLGTALGGWLGPVLGDPQRLGLDAAFPALFVALLWPMLRDRAGLRAAVAGAAVAVALSPFTPAGVPLAAAAVTGFAVARN